MDGKSYTPGGDFLSTMKWYSKYPGISCQFAPCEYATPDHSVLSRFQLNYYLWWRKKLKEGVFMKTSPGYVWLRVCELINVEDPGEGLRELELFKANAGYCGLSPDDIEKTAADLSIKGNLDLPCGLYGKDPVMRSMALSETLVYPVRTDSPVRIMYLAGTSETPDRKTVSVFFQALKGLESAFLKKNGKGIGKTFESGTETRTICLFEKYPYFGERYCRVTFSTYSSELKKFASDLLKWSSGGGPGAEFLSAYGGILKEIRLRPVNETLPEPSERGTIREFCTEEEWRKNKSSGNAREELKETLDDLVRSGKDPEKTLSQLYEIYLNQTKERQKKLAGNVCADYALARHLPVPEPGLVRNRDEACIYFEHFLRGNRKARPDRDMFLELAPGIGETAAGLFDEKAAEVVCKILSNVDNERLKNKWIGLCGICRKFTFETALYRGLGCETRTQIAYAGFSKNDFFAKQLGKLIEGVVTITALSSMDLPPVELEVFGIREEKLAELLVSGKVSNTLFTGPADRILFMKKPRPAKLDPEAVLQAEKDLTDVTDMLRTEDEEPAAAAEPAIMTEDGDPWQILSEKLSAGGKEYLRLSLEGTAFSSPLEKEVNDLSMDLIGDVIVENGKIIGEYRANAERLVGR